jgi:hypothetical protein
MQRRRQTQATVAAAAVLTSVSR